MFLNIYNKIVVKVLGFITFNFFLLYLFIFRERGREGEGAKHLHVRETVIGFLSDTSPAGTWHVP